MKQILLSLSTIISLLVLAQNKTVPQKIGLKGRVIGQDSGYVHLAYTNIDGKYQHDSCLLKKGYFEFTPNIAEPTAVGFYGRRKSGWVGDPNFTDFFLEPTTVQAVFKVDHFKEGKITGSNTQDEYTYYLKQNNQLDKKWKSVLDALRQAKEKNDTITLSELFDKKIPLYNKERDSLRLNFIRQHPNSFVSVNLLIYQTQKLTLDSLKMFYDLFSQKVQNSADGKYINEFIGKAKNLLPGKELSGFTQIDKDGKSISLKDFAGKYVLIDFWASWCVPCREEHPFLKEAYEKYNAKGFTIISISLDRLEDKNKWLTAIEKDGLTWTQLCDFKGWEGEVVNRYNLLGRGIPSNFLIDPEGKIVARDLRGQELKNRLNELLK